MKYISILRGINVSGQKKIKMIDLRSLYEKLGFENILTYIQSGNVIFESKEKNKAVLKGNLEKIIENNYQFHIPVEIRSNSELSKIIGDCPFGTVDLDKDGTKVLLTFLSSSPKKSNINDLLKHVSLPEQLVVKGKEVYIYCPDGYGKSKLNNNFIEKKLGVEATTRNWKSVHKLYELSLE